MHVTGRQRVVDALNHRQPDRMPIDFGATRSTGINAYAYRGLLERLGMGEAIRVFDFKQLLAQPGEEILRLFQSDCVPLYRLAPTASVALERYREVRLGDGNPYLLPEGYDPKPQADGSSVLLVDGVAVLRRPAGGLYFDDCHHPLAEAEGTLPPFALPAISAGEKAYLAARARALYENDDRAIVASSGISIFERGIKDWGFEEFLVRFYTDPDLIHQYLERLCDAYIAFLDSYLEAVGPYIQVLQCNDDLGMQSGPLIPPEIYRAFLKPRHARIFGHVKKLAPHVKVLLHCCGGVYDLIPDLIEAGVDALNPVQINAAGMEPARLKAQFGRDITFWGGGCSTQGTLTFGSLEDIRDEVRRMIDIFSPGGGFVFNQVHNIQNNVSPERILTLYEAAIRCRDSQPKGAAPGD